MVRCFGSKSEKKRIDEKYFTELLMFKKCIILCYKNFINLSFCIRFGRNNSKNIIKIHQNYT